MESNVREQPAATAGADLPRQPGHPNLLRGGWAKGQSGNPRGLGHRSVKQLIEILGADFEARSACEELLLEQSARLLLKAEKSGNVDAAIRAFGAVRRLLTHLHRRRAEDAPPSPRTSMPWSPDRERYGLLDRPVKGSAE